MPVSESHTHVTADQLQPYEDFAEMNAPGTEATSRQNVEATLVFQGDDSPHRRKRT